MGVPVLAQFDASQQRLHTFLGDLLTTSGIGARDDATAILYFLRALNAYEKAGAVPPHFWHAVRERRTKSIVRTFRRFLGRVGEALSP